jgi:hypothetical protein
MSNEPTFDREGYPTIETYDKIADWPINTFQDAIDAMEFVGRAWYYPEYWEVSENWTDPDYSKKVRRYVFSTGGWSGNETLISAIESNIMLQALGAYSWRKGGHYEYRFTEPNE